MMLSFKCSNYGSESQIKFPKEPICFQGLIYVLQYEKIWILNL